MGVRRGVRVLARVVGSGGGEGCGEVFPGRGCGVPGEGGGGQGVVGEAEPAAGFGDADPEPDPEELLGVPAAVIGRRRRDRGSQCT